MKKRNVFMMVLIGLLTLTAGFTSCSNDEEQLVGKWAYVDEDNDTVYFEFTADGKWYWWYSNKAKPSKPEGTYTYASSTISLSYSDPSEPIWGNTWKVKSLSGSKLVFTAYGYEITMKKVK